MSDLEDLENLKAEVTFMERMVSVRRYDLNECEGVLQATKEDYQKDYQKLLNKGE